MWYGRRTCIFLYKSLYELATEIFISNIHDVCFPYVLYDVTKNC